MSQEFASQTSPCRQAWAQHWAVKESRVELQSFYALTSEVMSSFLLHPIGRQAAINSAAFKV